MRFSVCVLEIQLFSYTPFAQQTLLLESRRRSRVFLRSRIVSSSAICLWQTRVLLGASTWAEVLQHIPGEPQIKISFAKTGSLVPLSDSFMAQLNAVRWKMFHKLLSPSWTYLRHGCPMPRRTLDTASSSAISAMTRAAVVLPKNGRKCLIQSFSFEFQMAC